MGSDHSLSYISDVNYQGSSFPLAEKLAEISEEEVSRSIDERAQRVSDLKTMVDVMLDNSTQQADFLKQSHTAIETEDIPAEYWA